MYSRYASSSDLTPGTHRQVKKFTDTQFIELFNTGMPMKDIARALNVDSTSVYSRLRTLRKIGLVNTTLYDRRHANDLPIDYTKTPSGKHIWTVQDTDKLYDLYHNKRMLLGDISTEMGINYWVCHYKIQHMRKSHGWNR